MKNSRSKINSALLGATMMFSSLGLGGCAISNPLAINHFNEDGVAMHTGSAAAQSTYVREQGDHKTLCITPAPDVALDENQSAGLSLSVLNFGDKGAESEDEGIDEVGLGGRSTNVLITREILYRQCEFFANTNLTDDEKRDLFEQTLQVIAQINSKSLGTGTNNNSTTVTLPMAKPQPLGDTASPDADEGSDTASDYGDDEYDGDDETDEDDINIR